MNWLWLVRLSSFFFFFFLLLGSSFIVFFYGMCYLDRWRRKKNDEKISHCRSIDRSFGTREKEEHYVPEVFLYAWVFFSTLSLLVVCVQPYVRKRHWSESESSDFFFSSSLLVISVSASSKQVNAHIKRRRTCSSSSLFVVVVVFYHLYRWLLVDFNKTIDMSTQLRRLQLFLILSIV